jgi:ACR3 family arsenite efflux pump ArsB
MNERFWPRAAYLARLRRIQVLIEVPVMLLVVKVVNASKGWYEAGGRA